MELMSSILLKEVEVRSFFDALRFVVTIADILVANGFTVDCQRFSNDGDLIIRPDLFADMTAPGFHCYLLSGGILSATMPTAPASSQRSKFIDSVTQV